MTFRELMVQLGEPHPVICKPPGFKALACQLPWQPFDRLKEVPGWQLLPRVQDWILFEYPVDEGRAVILGKLRIEDDGTQTLADVLAFLREPAPA